jgi:hypothetical protein
MIQLGVVADVLMEPMLISHTKKACATGDLSNSILGHKPLFIRSNIVFMGERPRIKPT